MTIYNRWLEQLKRDAKEKKWEEDVDERRLIEKGGKEMEKKWLAKWLRKQDKLKREGHPQCGVMVITAAMEWDEKTQRYTMPMYPTYDGC